VKWEEEASTAGFSRGVSDYSTTVSPQGRLHKHPERGEHTMRLSLAIAGAMLG